MSEERVTMPRRVPSPELPAYRFADLTLHVGQHRLERGGEPIELGRLTYALLVALVESAPNVLTHDDLVRAVWGGRNTAPETVTQRVKLLRDALDDDAQRPRYVGLVRGGGYRLIPPVERLDEPPASLQWDVSASRAAPSVHSGHSPAPIPRSAKRRAMVLAAASAVFLLLVLASGWALVRYAGSKADPTSASAFEMVQLTSSGRAFTPAISPDGRFVVYSQAGEDGAPESLWVRQIGTAHEVQVVAPDSNSVVLAPTVSRDGRFIDYVKVVYGKGRELWRVPFLGGSSRLLRPAASSPIGWSPDGKHGAFVGYDQGTNTSLIEVDDRFEERVLGTRTVPDFFVSLNIVGSPPARPAYSPDGRLIAIPVHRDILASRIAVIEAATRAEETYDSQGSFVPQGVGWLGPSMLVVSQPGAFGQRIQLFKMSYPDGAMTPLTNDLASYIGVDLDASRTRLVTTRRDVRASIWLADVSGQTAVQLVPPTPFGTPNQFLSWAGERVLFDSTFGGRAAIAAVAVGGGTPEEVVGDAFHVAAAPDGSAIVFASATRGRAGIWKVDGSGQGAIQLASGFAVEPVVTANRMVVYVTNSSGVQSPWSVPLDGGEATQIVAEHAVAIDVSPDGRRLAFWTWRGVDSIVVCELPRCSSRQDLDIPPSIAGLVLRWTPDGKELAYIDGPGQNIWAIPLDGAPPHALTSFAGDPGRIVRFAWSRDGRLAFVRASIDHDVVLLTGLRP